MMNENTQWSNANDHINSATKNTAKVHTLQHSSKHQRNRWWPWYRSIDAISLSARII